MNNNSYITGVNSATLSFEQQQFALDVVQGLSKKQKTLSSKYFYDGVGSKLFQKIMELPEYYLTHTETEIFTQQKEKIISGFCSDQPFNLVDLGAGDAAKTKILLRALLKRYTRFSFVPVDISSDALQELKENLTQELPQLTVVPLAGDYFEALTQLKQESGIRQVLLFLGSNIGNFTYPEIQVFLKKLRQFLQTGDQLLIGFDLKKDPRIIRQAYDDAAGVTASFNFNLLQRMNDTFAGNFNLKYFQHFAEYNPVTGEMRSYLISTRDQQITLQELDFTFSLQAWEAIHTESSYKFSKAEIQELAAEVNLETELIFTDANHYFADVLFRIR
ncbi:L-histidine N(alpha)-methyltransferase [Adhaeribacter radiodurans]|uniref:L-histidine N(Alpha)-methyltransferase n=2 Tax=Adhaeribacter radiodurans TaxID=2745197 RepID=A0A7L7LFF0_9BACT|nr:L-histidine N(alpha)-methyltransferase [Adhaeribacter radiodurans]